MSKFGIKTSKRSQAIAKKAGAKGAARRRSGGAGMGPLERKFGSSPNGLEPDLDNLRRGQADSDGDRVSKKRR